MMQKTKKIRLYKVLVLDPCRTWPTNLKRGRDKLGGCGKKIISADIWTDEKLRPPQLWFAELELALK